MQSFRAGAHGGFLPVAELDQSLAFDVQLGQTEFHRAVVERAQTTQLGELSVKIASLDDLILLKLLAYRPIDRADAIDLLAWLQPARSL